MTTFPSKLYESNEDYQGAFGHKMLKRPLCFSRPQLGNLSLLLPTVLLFLSLLGQTRVLAQAELPISGLATVFSDDASQWDIFDYEGERAGELKLRFPGIAGQLGDITQWSFRFGSLDGYIRPKVSGRNDVWEVRVGEQVAIVRTLFPNSIDQWTISAGKEQLVYAVRDYNRLEYWAIRPPGGPGLFEVFTTYEGDWRDWTVADHTEKPVSAATQLAMIWLPIYLRLTAN